MAVVQRHWAGLAVVLVFAASAILLFKDSFEEGKVFWEMDTLMFYYPIAVRVDQALAQGRLPLWTTAIFGGHPLLADGEAGMLYPINQVLWWLLSAQDAFLAMRIVRFTMAGLFTYGFLRSLRLSRVSSLLGGLTFTYGSFMVGQLHHANVSASLVWLPLSLRYAELSLQASGWRRLLNVVLIGAALGMLALTIHINAALMTALVLGSYVSYRCLFGPVAGYSWRLAAGAKNRLARLGQYAWGVLGALTRRAALAAVILGGAGLVGVGLGAGQLLPLWELAQQSPRYAGVDYRFATSFALPPANLLTLVLPYFFRDARDLYWSPWFRWDTTVYVGMVPLVLAAVAIFLRRSRLTVYFILLVLAGLLLSVGDYLPFKPYAWIWQLPIFSMTRVPSRFILFVSFGLAVLAAQGLDYLQTALAPTVGVRATVRSLFRLPARAVPAAVPSLARRSQRGLLALIVCTLLLAAGLPLVMDAAHTWVTAHPAEASAYMERIYPRGDRNPVLDAASPDAAAGLKFSLDVYSRWTARTVIWLALAGVLLGLWYCGRALGPVWPVALVLLAMVDLMPFARDFHPRYRRDDLSPHTALVQFLTEHNGLNRVFAAWPVTVVGPNRLLPLRIADAGGYSSLMTRRYADYMGAGQRSSSRFLDMMNVRYVIVSPRSAPGQTARATQVFVEGDISVYERSDYLPRAYVVTDARSFTSERDVMSALNSPGFDPSRSVILEGATPEAARQGDIATVGDVSSKVDVLTYEPENVAIEAEAARSGYLVLADTYYPGWEARVDGELTPIYRANYLFRAVPLPAGRHVVEFSYHPLSVGLGALLTVVSGFSVIGVLALAIFRRRAE